MAHIFDLPLEIILIIFRLLDINSEHMWYLTCRYFHSFIKYNLDISCPVINSIDSDRIMIVNHSSELTKKSIKEIFLSPMQAIEISLKKQTVNRISVSPHLRFLNISIYYDEPLNINAIDATSLEYLKIERTDNSDSCCFNESSPIKHVDIYHRGIIYDSFAKKICQFKTLKSIKLCASYGINVTDFSMLNGLYLKSLELEKITMNENLDLKHIFMLTTLKRLVLTDRLSTKKKIEINIDGLSRLTKLTYLKLSLPISMEKLCSSIRSLKKVKTMIIEKANQQKFYPLQHAVLDSPKLKTLIIEGHNFFSELSHSHPIEIAIDDGIEKCKFLEKICGYIILPSNAFCFMPNLKVAEVIMKNPILNVPSKMQILTLKYTTSRFFQAIRTKKRRGIIDSIDFIRMMPDLQYLSINCGSNECSKDLPNICRSHPSLKYIEFNSKKLNGVLLPDIPNTIVSQNEMINTLSSNDSYDCGMLSELIANNDPYTIEKIIGRDNITWLNTTTYFQEDLFNFDEYRIVSKDITSVLRSIELLISRHDGYSVMKICLINSRSITLKLSYVNGELIYQLLFYHCNKHGRQDTKNILDNINCHLILIQNGFRCISYRYKTNLGKSYECLLRTTVWVKNKSFIFINYHYTNIALQMMINHYDC